MTNLRRIGQQEKCPACGWRLDAEAYRCPKCFIYFCYKCRARVIKGDPQYQCADQSCDCYGKLLCAACTVMVPEFQDFTETVVEAPMQTVSKGDNWGWAAIILAGGIGIWLWVKFSFLWGGIAAITVFAVSAVLLRKAGSSLFSHTEHIPAKWKQVTGSKQIADHRCCIVCQHPTKHLG